MTAAFFAHKSFLDGLKVRPPQIAPFAHRYAKNDNPIYISKYNSNAKASESEREIETELERDAH